MSVNALDEEYEHVEGACRYGLFTNSRIDPATIPKDWFCYDLRGSDSDPGIPISVEKHVAVNHAGCFLVPLELDFKGEDHIDIEDNLNFLGEKMTIEEFCVEYDLPYPLVENKYDIQPAHVKDAGLFYAAEPEKDRERGCIGHVRIDFGRDGDEFWHTWWPRGPEELNSPEFKEELSEIVNDLRLNVLRGMTAMRHYCNSHNGKIPGGWEQNYGYEINTDRYRYCLRCNPIQGDYNAYLTCYDKQAQQLYEELNCEQTEPEENPGMTMGGML